MRTVQYILWTWKKMIFSELKRSKHCFNTNDAEKMKLSINSLRKLKEKPMIYYR